MTRFLLFFLLTFSFSAVKAAFDTDIPRGEQKSFLAVPNRKAELCVKPTHFGGAEYSEKDLSQENSLCQLNVYENSAVCPKLNSSNPGLLFYSLKDGMTPAEVEAQNCEIPGVKKLAKYKLSTSCSYTPSIVAYYHLSRMLGGTGQVPPAVLRTFDLNRHVSLGQLALSQADPNSLIYKTWSTLLTHLQAGSQSPRKDLLLTNTFDQSYGALQMNPKGEEFYNEFFVPGADQTARAIGFRDKAPVAQLLKDIRPLNEFVGQNPTAENVQKFFAMKDASEMILLDTLLNQQDRFGNIHYVLQSVALPSAKDAGVQIKRMLLKDNDCGIIKENVSKKAELLGIVKHLDPKVYRRILELEGMIDTPAVQTFFLNNLAFTANDFAGFRKNLLEVSQTLKSECLSQSLHLDLNFEVFFLGKPAAQPSCEL